jgi:prepilin-type N-terminal cleavage/methylation domain-containing protein
VILRGRGPAADRRGFTLVEILLVITLLVVIVGALGWGSSFFRGDNRLTPDERVWGALRKARETALLGGREVQAVAVEKTERERRATRIELRSGPDLLETIEIGDAPRVVVKFLSVRETDRSLSLIGGQVQEGGPAVRAVFYPDGTCSRFRVQVSLAGESRVTEVDPWTCAAMLPSPSPK